MAQFEVSFSAARFPVAVAPHGLLRFDESDLAHALFVTGRAPGDRMSHGVTSFWELIHRVSIVPAYVRRSSTKQLFRSALAESLDRSEKALISYALGQALTGIFCQHRLSVTHLMHVDRYAARWGVVFGGGRSRPDLFGRTASGEWVVAEAKGRSNAMESGLVRKLRDQKGMIRAVAGRPPAVSLGCVAHFPNLSGGLRGPIQVDAVDPDLGQETIALGIIEDNFFRAYYEPFVAAIEIGQPSKLSTDRVLVADFPTLSMSFGLLRDYYDTAKLPSGRPQLWSDLVIEGRGAITVDGTPLRSDGTFVRASWSDQLESSDFEEG